jgi:hypothetical protein
MRLCEIEHQGPFPRDQEDMNPHNILEDPPRCWVLHRLPCVVGKGGAVILQRLANALRHCCIHQQAHRHHHPERHDPLGRFEIARGGQQAGVFENTTAAFRQGLAFIAGSQLLRG